MLTGPTADEEQVSLCLPSPYAVWPIVVMAAILSAIKISYLGHNKKTMSEAAKSAASALTKVQDLYNTHWKELCDFVRARFGAGPPDPEDVAQTSFIKFADAQEKQEIKNPKAFLYRTANNLVIDHHRCPKNQLPTEDQINSFESSADSYISNPEFVNMSRQKAEVVQEAIMQLSERDRAFFLMNRIEGMSYTDISNQVDMTRVGVQKVIARALAKIEDAVIEAGLDEFGA